MKVIDKEKKKNIKNLYITTNDELLYFQNETEQTKDNNIYISQLQKLQQKALNKLRQLQKINKKIPGEYLVTLEYITPIDNNPNKYKTLIDTFKLMYEENSVPKYDINKRLLNTFYYVYDEINDKFTSKLVIAIETTLDKKTLNYSILYRSSDLTSEKLIQVMDEIKQVIDNYVFEITPETNNINLKQIDTSYNQDLSL
ncbi:hypothetical protein DEFDS_P080 (plasmid) [Deferribacter desulfuricans SSM1]|uniref:Uncharacterized protein n=1 Tax=Deferribacter desulfuricans (strain DSM 14783 / JCM 11476 / NBRC 101012 / SSM1) TaxID=639282 RepID=D3PER2_DEFDS|nr:hypothetical protein [Deferribacter desulfuricans]BAI81704.1 hypothetical protein DEFDS_P080 [Deferribacter desulfuricans SSM1]